MGKSVTATVDVVEVVQQSVLGLRTLVERREIRVRVVDSTRAAFVQGEHHELSSQFTALLSDLLERAPPRSQLNVQVRELCGFVRVDCTCDVVAAAAKVNRGAVARAGALVARSGGEFWERLTGESGFGLTLPQLRPMGTAAASISLVREGRAALRCSGHAPTVDSI